MSDDKRFYLTTPIYYVNDSPHIGHAYTTLACDALARFMRLDGYDVFFLTGTDEHGQKVEKSAQAAGIDPQVFTDRVSENFRELAKAMNFSNDAFIRTTEPRHAKASQAIWQALMDNGHIYLGSYSGWYAVRDEAFYDESELTEDEDGIKRAPSGAEAEWVEEPSYFFDLSKWQDRLLAFYDANPDFIAPPSRRNEVVSFVKGGLKDLSVSRTSFKWGVPVPDDADHIMYVWLDALTNYATAVDYPDKDSQAFSNYWPCDLHMVGKDILRFHAVYWPAFLMGAGIDPPKRVFAHGWWTNEGQKISKSIGNIIDPFDVVERYGLDQLRYFLLREVPFGNDGDFSHRAMVNRINGDLANDLGNLVQRVTSMIHRYFDGTMPVHEGGHRDADGELLDAASGLLETCRDRMRAQAFHEVLDAVWSVIRQANAYVGPSGAVGIDQGRQDSDRGGARDAGPDDPPRRDRLAALHAGLGGPHPRSAGRGSRTPDVRQSRLGRQRARGDGAPQTDPGLSPAAGGGSRRGGVCLMLVDSHCHLDFDAFDGDRAEVLERAAAAGVGRVVTICTRLTEFERVRALARDHRAVDCSVGIHPHNVEDEGTAETARLVTLAAEPEVVGIGETGLDFYYDHSPRDVQRASFRNHIAAARETGLPLIVHTRDADDETAAILSEEMEEGAFPGVIHCFSAGPALAETAIELGLYISFSGIVTFRKSDELRGIAAEVPLDRLLVETDAPYLAPVPRRGKRNEPAFVAHTAAAIAEVKGIDVDLISQQTTDNFFRLFRKSAVRAGP